MPFDGVEFGREIVKHVQGYVAKSLEPVLLRLKALEEREPVNGKDGRDGRDGTDGSPGEKGEKGDPGEPGKDGRDGTDGRDGAPGEAGKPGERGEKGDPGIDGKDGAAGRDGLPGQPGRDGKDGDPGKDGQDGLGFDDLEFFHDGERSFTLRFMRGERVKEFAFSIPTILDRGVWKQRGYERGDGVTLGGSFFIAQKDTDAKPGDSDDWRLAVKRGRDGRDATDKKSEPATVRLK